MQQTSYFGRSVFAFSRLAIAFIALATMVTANLWAKDSANIPTEVVIGWRELAKQTGTYRAVWVTIRADGKEDTRTLIASRLNHKYAKTEGLPKGSAHEALQDGFTNWEDKIADVVLFDGQEYFMLGRRDLNDKLKLVLVGEAVTLAPVLRVGRVQSTDAFGKDLLEAYESTTDEFTSYERQHDEATVTLKTGGNGGSDGATITIKLDPKNNYRVISGIRIPNDIPNFRGVAKYEYDNHPAISSKHTYDIELQKPGTDLWEPKGEIYPFTTYWRIIGEQPASSREFSLEHYGLPPFRKRQQSLWSLATIGAAVVVVAGGVFYWWRRRNAES